MCENGLFIFVVFFFFQAEDGIRYLVRSRGLGDVYKRQSPHPRPVPRTGAAVAARGYILGRSRPMKGEVVGLSLIHI